MTFSSGVSVDKVQFDLSPIGDSPTCKELCDHALSLYYYERTQVITRITGKKISAFHVFQQALIAVSASTDYETKLYIASNLDNLRSAMVVAWHWRMLNDKRRNNTFGNAIRRAIERCCSLNKGRKPRLLDIGCGSGIFSIVASGSCDVAACEVDDTMSKIAEKCMNASSANGIHLARCHSSQLECTKDDGDFPRFDILVTETLDCAVFGEEIIDTVIHARRQLLQPNAITIPEKVFVEFALVESVDIAREHYCQLNFQDSSNSEELVMLSEECGLPWECFTFLPEESFSNSTYTCDYLNELPNGYRVIGGPTTGFSLDFQNGAQLSLFSSERFASNVVLHANVDGVVNAVVAWFRLKVFDDIELCTSPERGHCWQQTVFPVFPPQRLTAGSKLRCAVMVRENRLCLRPYVANGMLRPFRVLRATPERPLDLPLIQSEQLNHFFQRSLHANRDDIVVDCSDLLLYLRKSRLVYLK